jgi:predicted transcriptional regulator
MDRSCDLIELTVALVASFVAHNAVTAAELPALLASTHAALKELTANQASQGTGRPHR